MPKIFVIAQIETRSEADMEVCLSFAFWTAPTRISLYKSPTIDNSEKK